MRDKLYPMLAKVKGYIEKRDYNCDEYKNIFWTMCVAGRRKYITLSRAKLHKAQG